MVRGKTEDERAAYMRQWMAKQSPEYKDARRLENLEYQRDEARKRTPEQRAVKAAAAAVHRAARTPEQVVVDAAKAHTIYVNRTPAKVEADNIKRRAAVKVKREAESPEETSARMSKQRAAVEKYRANRSPEKLEMARARSREHNRCKRAVMSPRDRMLFDRAAGYAKGTQFDDRTMTPEVVGQMWDAAVHCSYCGGPLGETNWVVDHIFPKSRGGMNSRGNAAVCCKTCNNRKTHFLPEEWLRFMAETDPGQSAMAKTAMLAAGEAYRELVNMGQTGGQGWVYPAGELGMHGKPGWVATREAV